MSEPAITDYLIRNVEPVLQSLPGVSQAKIYGTDYAMNITLNPLLMAAYNLTATDVKNAITESNVMAAAGQIENPSEIYNASLETGLTTAQQF